MQYTFYMLGATFVDGFFGWFGFLVVQGISVFVGVFGGLFLFSFGCLVFVLFVWFWGCFGSCCGDLLGFLPLKE